MPTASPVATGAGGYLDESLWYEVVSPKHGGPHRPRPAAFASCSAAAISSAGPRDGREGFVPIVAENFAQGGTKAICIDRESLLQLGRCNSYITIAEAAECLRIGGHAHVSAHGAATMPVLIHQMNQQAPMGW